MASIYLHVLATLVKRHSSLNDISVLLSQICSRIPVCCFQPYLASRIFGVQSNHKINRSIQLINYITSSQIPPNPSAAAEKYVSPFRRD